MIISLLGYMGCGKSTFGKRLANKLSLDFIDLDKEIQKDQELTINEIFERKGENYFREVETRVLKRVLSKDNVVLSLGGGTPCFNDNMNIIKTSSLSVYLNLTPKALFSRLKAGKLSRPLIASKTDEELLGFISRHLHQRESYYKQADILFDPIKKTERDLMELLPKNYSK